MNSSAKHDSCCGAVENLDGASPSYKRALWLVVALNGAMFLIGGTIAVLGRTVSVQADALDFLGDALATGVGLVLIGRSARVRSTAALWQGVALAALGLFTAGSVLWRVFVGTHPEALSMGAYGTLGLIVNVTCALLLVKHQGRDATARAVWLYSRNDAIGNVAVLVAAGLVVATATRWPDLVAAAVIATLFLHSAFTIIRDARGELAREGAR
ncbi:cation transporter [Caulobacter sp. 17J65-9]|uniref:cation transporter n=1 Tax=Caulobacter sp. 17J65-9 TaxID=2709382 RepID=UPI0013C60CBF|nr:cation transporter [Caulobacter sp. 17J65-9]NEX91145.1 cation transporter [Caulobacter sp. 17J65-9]